MIFSRERSKASQEAVEIFANFNMDVGDHAIGNYRRLVADHQDALNRLFYDYHAFADALRFGQPSQHFWRTGTTREGVAAAAFLLTESGVEPHSHSMFSDNYERSDPTVSSVPSPKSLEFRCVQNGSSARREEGAYLDRYVTDEQRSSRPIFNATLRAAASWLFFRVARSTRMTQRWALYRQSGSDRLEKQPTDLRRNSRDFGDG